MTKLVVTLRTAESEHEYRVAREKKLLKPIADETPIISFNYWRIVDNRYPYDVAFAKHHLLIPIRKFAEHSDMNLEELCELNELHSNYIAYEYHMMFENMPGARSIKDLYHIHLARYYNNRTEMSL